MKNIACPIPHAPAWRCRRAVVLVLATVLALPQAMAQPGSRASAKAPDATAAPAVDGPVATDTPAYRLAAERERDAETTRALTADARVLLERDSVRLTAQDYCSMANAAAERGDLRDSIQAASRALLIGQQQKDEDTIALATRDLAIAYSYAGELDAAQSFAEQALATPGASAAQVHAPARKVLGDIALRRGQPDEAIQQYQLALNDASARYRDLVLLSLTNAQIAAGQVPAARETFGKIPQGAGMAVLPTVKRTEGNLLLAEGEPRRAERAFEAIATQSRASADGAYDALWAHEGMGRAYEALGDKAKARMAYRDATDDADRIRARFRSEEFKSGLFSDTQMVFEKALEMAVADKDFEEAWRLSERSRARALLDVVRNRVSTGVDMRQLNGENVTLQDVRETLRPDEALVEFHSLDRELVIWVIRRDGLQGFVLPIARHDLELAVNDLRGAITGRRRSALTFATRLDQLLLAPLGLRREERLIIVPHGALHYMPFQALRNDAGYLIERHPVALAPSASVAVALARRHADVRSTLVAFGNPLISPAYALPGAEVEVRNIAPLFSSRELFFGDQATRVRFRQNAQAGRVLHVATHAEADTVDPLASRILLAPDRPPVDGPDALLARDIYNLKLDNVALVTLSACETGLGRIARGDEIMGFTRAFFYAGASSLIVSLWPVSDESSELTMTTFYQSLSRGQQAIDAMQAAQLAVLRTPRFAHPFFWAPFDLMGNWRLTLTR